MVEIGQIKNQWLQYAADKADNVKKEGNCDGELNSSELSNFMKFAMKETDADYSEILDVINEVGVEETNTDLKSKVEKLNRLKELDQEMEAMNKELADLKDQCKGMKAAERKAFEKEYTDPLEEKIWNALDTYTQLYDDLMKELGKKNKKPETDKTKTQTTQNTGTSDDHTVS